MIHRRSYLAGLLAWGLCAALQAGDYPFTHEAKIRAAFAGTQQDQLGSSALGIGINLGYAAWGGKLTAELGYSYKTGKDWLEPIGNAPANMTAVDYTKSMDHRKNQVDGLDLRFAYERAIPDSHWGWQAGLMIGGTEFSSQVQGDVRSLNWAYVATQPNPPIWRDQYWYSRIDHYIGTSPFVGFKWSYSKSAHLEFNLILLNYRSSYLVHYPGAASVYRLDTPNYLGQTNKIGPLSNLNDFPLDRVEKHVRFDPHFEIGYAFHF